MKIIFAGYSKTGTKSVNAALTELGYEVYDYLEHFWYHEEEWKKILGSGGSVDDFKRMYKDVDVIMDVPVHAFWEEIHWAFPDAKIILTTRDEDSWFKSFCGMLRVLDNDKFLHLIIRLSRTGNHYFRHAQALFPICLGPVVKSIWKAPVINEMLMKQKFRQHNAYVVQNAPKDKLLVYNVKEGWKPLCKFLGKDVPDKPFPRKNVLGKQIQEDFTHSPFARKLKKEILVTLSIFLGFGVLAGYHLWKRCSSLSR